MIGTAVNAIAAEAGMLDCKENDAGELLIRFAAAPGLYQLTVIADASDFDWEELYVPLYTYGNSGQRTGPWDFHPTEGARALVPSYCTDLDGKELGLWYFQRISVDDLRHRRFRVRLAFRVPEGVEHVLKLKQYRPTGITWTLALLEVDPEDAIAEAPEWPADWFDRCPAADWRQPHFWQRIKANLDGSQQHYAEPLRAAFGWLDDPANRTPQSLPLQIAKYALSGDPSALRDAIETIDRVLELKHLGNPRPDGNGHDGDMGAMYSIWSLTYVYHALHGELGEERRRRMIDKLTVQGRRFFDKVLLYATIGAARCCRITAGDRCSASAAPRFICSASCRKRRSGQDMRFRGSIGAWRRCRSTESFRPALITVCTCTPTWWSNIGMRCFV
jgi:hypothetical protein